MLVLMDEMLVDQLVEESVQWMEHELASLTMLVWQLVYMLGRLLDHLLVVRLAKQMVPTQESRMVEKLVQKLG